MNLKYMDRREPSRIGHVGGTWGPEPKCFTNVENHTEHMEIPWKLGLHGWFLKYVSYT